MKFAQRTILLAGMMIAASLSAKILMPTEFIAKTRSSESLKQLVPAEFGGWKEDKAIVPLMVDPSVEAQLANVYSETLSRTYVNDQGQRVMLSLAYGSDQRGEGRAHYPEICYPAQGFQIKQKQGALANISSMHIPVIRLVAAHGERVEPITYWVVVGDELVTSALEHKTAIIRYGVHGQIPDGLLVRISSISGTPGDAFELQDRFATAMIGALPQQQRSRLLGKFSSK
jgi:EpsI family protein